MHNILTTVKTNYSRKIKKYSQKLLDVIKPFINMGLAIILVFCMRVFQI